MDPELKAYLDEWSARRRREFDAILDALLRPATELRAADPDNFTAAIDTSGGDGPVQASSGTTELVTTSVGLYEPPATTPIIEESLAVTPVVPVDTMDVAPASYSTECPSRDATAPAPAFNPAAVATSPTATVDVIPLFAAAAADDGVLDGEPIKGAASTAPTPTTERSLAVTPAVPNETIAVAHTFSSPDCVTQVVTAPSPTPATTTPPLLWASTRPWLEPIPPRPPDPWSLFPGAWSRSRPEASSTVQWQHKEYIAPVSNIWMLNDFQCVQQPTAVFEASLGHGQHNTGIPMQDLVLGSVLKTFRSGAAPSLLTADSMESGNNNQDGILGAYHGHVYKQKQKCMAREFPMRVVSADFHLKIAWLSTCHAPVMKLLKLSYDCTASIGVHLTRTTVRHTNLCAEGNKFRNLTCSQPGVIFKHQGASHVEHTTLSRCQVLTGSTTIHSKAIIPCLNVMMGTNILLYALEYVRSGQAEIQGTMEHRDISVHWQFLRKEEFPRSEKYASDNLTIDGKRVLITWSLTSIYCCNTTVVQSSKETMCSELVCYYPVFKGMDVVDMPLLMWFDIAIFSGYNTLVYEPLLTEFQQLNLLYYYQASKFHPVSVLELQGSAYNLFSGGTCEAHKVQRSKKFTSSNQLQEGTYIKVEHLNYPVVKRSIPDASHCSGEDHGLARASHIWLVAWIVDGLEFSTGCGHEHFQGGTNVIRAVFFDQVHASCDYYIACANQISVDYEYYLDQAYYVDTVCSDIISYREDYHGDSGKTKEVHMPWDPGKSSFKHTISKLRLGDKPSVKEGGMLGPSPCARLIGLCHGLRTRGLSPAHNKLHMDTYKYPTRDDDEGIQDGSRTGTGGSPSSHLGSASCSPSCCYGI